MAKPAERSAARLAAVQALYQMDVSGKGVVDALAYPPRDGRQQAVLGRRAACARVLEHEAARAVGVLGHPRLQAGLAEQRSLLVAGDA